MSNHKVTTKKISVRNTENKSLKKLKCYVRQYSLKEKENKKAVVEEQKRDI